MSALLFVLRAASAAIVAGVFCLLVRWACPDIEVAVAPVIVRQVADHVERLDGGATVCWTSRFDKVRAATIIDAGWTIRGGGQVYPFQRVRRVADSDEDGDRLVLRPVRRGQWSRKCIDVPPELRVCPFRITGFVEHRTALTGALWTVRQPVAEVTVP